MRPVAVSIQLNHTLVIHERFTESVHGNEDGFSGPTIEKFHDDVQEAHTGAIGAHDGFRNFAFALKAVQPALRVEQLFLKLAICTAPFCILFLLGLLGLPIALVSTCLIRLSLMEDTVMSVFLA